jgi:cellulose biosynthesis protein BcsQ
VPSAGPAAQPTPLLEGEFLTPPQIVALTGFSPRTVARRLAASAAEPIGRENRLRVYRRSDVAPILARAVSTQMYRVAVAHRKGGQAKTTTTYYLGRELAERGKRVVLRDTDSQRSLTEVLDGLEAERDKFGRRHLQRRLVLAPDGVPLPFRPDFELIDTPPSLDDSLPGIRRADGVVIPLTVDFQSVSALRWMLEYLHATRDRQPDLEVIAVQPTRLFPRRQAHLVFLDEITGVCQRFGVPLLPPIVEDASVCTFSMRGHLWAGLAERVVACAEQAAAGRLGMGVGHGG